MADPIFPDLPDTLERYRAKYAGTAPDPNNVLYPALRAASPAARSALANVDLERIRRGQDPLTATQSALGVTAATRNRAVTPEPEPTSIFSAALSDLSSIVRSVPQLPAMFFKEARAFPDALSALPAALANEDGGGPLNTLGNVANLPGFRFIPGSFVAGAFGDPYTDPITGAEVTPEGVDTLTEHPLFTALDVLPFASKAARMSPQFRAAEAAYLEQARVLSNPRPRAPRPIPTAIRQLGGSVEQVADLRSALLDRGQMPERGLGAAGINEGIPVAGPVVNPGPVGRALDSSAARFARTGPGRWAQDLRGVLARTVTERGGFHSSHLTDPQRAADLDPQVASIYYDVMRELTDMSESITPERMATLTDDLTSGRFADPAHAATYTSAETAYLDRFMRGQDEIQQYLLNTGHTTYDLGRRHGAPRGDKARANVRGLLEVEFPHGTEIYDYATGSRILDARHKANMYQWFGDKLDQYRTNTPVNDLSAVQAELLSIMDDKFMRTAEKRQAARLSLAHAHRSGFNDMAGFIDALDKARNEADLTRLRDAIADPKFTAFTQHPLNHAQRIADDATTLSAHTTDPRAVLLRDHLSNGRWSDALAEIRKLKSRRVYQLPVDLDNLRIAVRDASFADKLEQSITGRLKITPRTTRTQFDRVAAMEAKAVPARWSDLVQRDATSNLIAEISNLQAQGRLTPELANQAIDAASNQIIARVESILGSADPMFVRIIDDVKSEARQSWQALAQSGLEPRWVHRVTPEQAQRMANPRVLDNPTLSAGQLKARLWDPAPYVKDLNISLHHQAYDILQSIASRNFADEMGNWYGVTGQELSLRYEARARAHAARKGIPYQSALNELVTKDYSLYDPAKFTRGKRPKGLEVQVSGSAGQMFVPRTVAATLEALRPTPLSSLGKALGKPMQVFRTSLLPLSPRWHLYNIVGGAIMLGATMSPRDIIRFADAYRMAREGGEELGRITSDTGKVAMPPGGHARFHQEWFQDMARTPRRQAALAHSVAGGSTLGRIFRDIWESRASTATRDRAARIIEGSYDFNQFVDNFYRSMSYLSGEQSALRRGMSQADAVDAGIVAARDALQSWDRLTPVERSGMRVLFPFYSWTAHLFRFVMQYPHDHPWRLAITARVAETEFTDMQTGLPQKFQSMFTPFGIDAEGNTTALLPDGINPFKDVTNWGMLAGFMLGQQEGNIATITSSLNPFVGVALESAGFDTFRGNPDLYPDLAYNPATGQLSALPNGNPLLNLATSIVPQSEVLVNMAGMNADFNDLWRRDPDAARRMLWGSLGLPSSLVRGINVNEETIKAEMQRWEQFSDTRAQALTSGNLGALSAYPVLDAYRTQMERLQDTGALDEYMPTTNPETADRFAGRGLADFLLPQ